VSRLSGSHVVDGILPEPGRMPLLRITGTRIEEGEPPGGRRIPVLAGRASVGGRVPTAHARGTILVGLAANECESSC